MDTKLMWAILCQQSSIDSATNNISLFNIVEELHIGIDMNALEKNIKDKDGFDPNQPMIFPFNLTIASLWKNLNGHSARSFSFKIQLIDPTGKILLDNIQEAVFEEGKPRSRVMMSLNGIPLTSSGEYKYLILSNDGQEYKEVGSIPLQIDVKLDRTEKNR